MRAMVIAMAPKKIFQLKKLAIPRTNRETNGVQKSKRSTDTCKKYPENRISS